MSWAFVGEAGIFGEIREFLKSAHEIDEREAKASARYDDEEEGLRKDIRRKSVEIEAQYEKEDEDDAVQRGRTLAEIRQGLQKKYDEDAIEQALKENEDEIAHWPHPEEKRYTLAQHLESNRYAEDFIPGVG